MITRSDLTIVVLVSRGLRSTVVGPYIDYSAYFISEVVCLLQSDPIFCKAARTLTVLHRKPNSDLKPNHDLQWDAHCGQQRERVVSLHRCLK
eukprot:COSAG02_NODE_8261_length_2638_cov_55.172817_3_plen_92_part_00